MSQPSHPESPVETAEGTPPTTSEIPVVRTPASSTRSLPPHPGATTMNGAYPDTVDTATQLPASAGAPQPTGPVDFVPGLPGLGTPPPPPPAAPQPVPPAPVAPPAVAEPPAAQPQGSSAVWPQTLESELTPTKRRAGARAARNRRALARVGLGVLSLVLLQLGLFLEFGTESFWSALTFWSAFATLAVVVALLAFVLPAAPGKRLGAEPAWRIAAAGLVGLAVFWLLVALPNADSDRGFLLTAALGALGGALWAGTGTTHDATEG